MPHRPGELLHAGIRKITYITGALRHRPRGLSLWTTGRACLASVVPDVWGRARRARRLPYPVVSLHEEHVQTAKASDRGVIFVSVHSNYAHISLSWFLNAAKSGEWNIHAISSGENPHTFRTYERVFTSVLLSTSGLRSAARILQRGEGLVLLQDIFADDGVPIQLYDRVAHFRLGAARLAEMTDSLILPYIALSRRGQGMIHWWPPIDPRVENGEKALVDAIARMIHTYPASWRRLGRLILDYNPTEP